MKKVVALLVTFAMLFSLTVVAFADTGAFIESPSKKRAPTLVSFKIGTVGCKGQIVITGYADRASLSADARTAIEAAYAMIKGTKDVTTLSTALASLATSKGIKASSLAVSELFDVALEGCTEHTSHAGVEVVISPESLVGFVGLIHFENNAWTLVTSATVDGENLKFTVDTLSPFAIVVNTEELEKPNETGDAITYVLISLAVLSAAGLVAVAVSKKQRA